jgi:aldose 1-epimerase
MGYSSKSATWIAPIVGGALLVLANGAAAVTAGRAPFGTLERGVVIEAVTLTNQHGMSARIVNYGATLQALQVPDRNGRTADIVLGYDANRIAGGRFALDGKTYQLSLNDQSNSLHGGARGFDKQVWRITGIKEGPVAGVTMELTSPAGDQGYPGTLQVRATYSLDESGALTIDYDAATDAPTIVNITNHAIFNLAGEGAAENVLGHRLTIPASRYTPIDAALIPTGDLRAVAGTVFDFSGGRLIGEGVRDGRDPQIVFGRGYDHNFALNAGATREPKLAARLEEANSGRVLEVLSTEPGIQVYTGNFLDGTRVGKHGHLYRMGDGIALEPQKFPDTPNRPGFGSARVDPGSPYHHRMVFHLFTVQ